MLASGRADLLVDKGMPRFRATLIFCIDSLADYQHG